MRGIVGSNLTGGHSFKISSDSIFFLKSPCLPMPIFFKNWPQIWYQEWKCYPKLPSETFIVSTPRTLLISVLKRILHFTNIKCKKGYFEGKFSKFTFLHTLNIPFRKCQDLNNLLINSSLLFGLWCVGKVAKHWKSKNFAILGAPRLGRHWTVQVSNKLVLSRDLKM